MMNSLIDKFMVAFDSEFRGHLSNELTIEALLNHGQFDFNLFAKEVINAINTEAFPWVEKAISANFVYVNRPFDKKERLDTDDLIIFTDSYRWRDIVKPDAWLFANEKDQIKEIIRGINFEWKPHFRNSFTLGFKRFRSVG
jgi:hypothetical protein